MKIHPLWIICLMIRTGLIFLTKYINKKEKYHKYVISLFLIIGIGFTYKAITGSNNETQINKVFWHKTRFVHGIFYILSAAYLYLGNIKMAIIMLSLDILFSLLFRFIYNT
jgi:hypothetical protein